MLVIIWFFRNILNTYSLVWIFLIAFEFFFFFFGKEPWSLNGVGNCTQRSGAGTIPKDSTGTGNVPRDHTGAGKSTWRPSAGKVPGDPTGAGKYPEIQYWDQVIEIDICTMCSRKRECFINILNTYSLVWIFFLAKKPEIQLVLGKYPEIQLVLGKYLEIKGVISVNFFLNWLWILFSFSFFFAKKFSTLIT